MNIKGHLSILAIFFLRHIKYPLDTNKSLHTTKRLHTHTLPPTQVKVCSALALVCMMCHREIVAVTEWFICPRAQSPHQIGYTCPDGFGYKGAVPVDNAEFGCGYC